MLHAMIDFIVNLVGDLGYFGIVFMMFLESSFFPFPSEVVMIPAGYLASKGEMNIFIVIGAGILGSILGALLNYYLAVKLGRKLVIKYGKYFFFDEEKMEKVEKFFRAHGHISTFSGRLIPVVRQYISFPAGLARMNLGVFTFYTALGAGIWMIVLSLLGYFIGENEALVKEYLHTILAITLVSVLILVSVYIRRHKKRSKV